MLSLKVNWLNRRNTEYTTSIMADSARVPERIAWKRDQKGQSIASCPSSFAVASTSNVSNPTFLAENDIPGASLLGRKPEELKISELKFWLNCRGDAGTRLKTKAERSAWLHTTLVSGQNWGRNCFLFTFEHFIKFAYAKLVWQITTVTMKSCGQLHLVDPGIYSFPAKAILLLHLCFFQQNW